MKEEQELYQTIKQLGTSKVTGQYQTVLLVKLNGKPFNIAIIQAYASTTESSEEDIETFYNELDLVQSHCKSQNIITILSDFSAKVGSERFEDIVGPHGLT